MQLTEILARMGGLESLARELGINETDARGGAEALLPAILGGFKKQAQEPAGFEGLGGLVGQLGGGDLQDDVLGPQPTDVSRGNGILEQIFGSKDVSRAVAQNASAKSGLDTGILKKMLPMLAMLVTGFMARQRSNVGATSHEGQGLAGLLGNVAGGTASGNGGGGLGSLLDMDGDGNPLDDILRLVGKATR